jgi:hypothetical protein
MKRIFGFLLLLPAIGFSQNIEIDRDKIIDNEISQITIRFKAVKSLHDYDSLIIGEHAFNKYGLKTFEKLVYPFQDVVATADQTFYKYENDTILIKEIKTHNAVRLTKKDDSYISFFGIDYDTTFVDYNYYKNGLLKSEIEYSNTSKDTITKEYFYNEANQLTKLIQSNSSQKGQLHQDNFKELYCYSEQGLLDSIQNYPTGFDSHSTEVYTYNDNKSLIEKRKVNGFGFTTIVNYGAENKVEIKQELYKGEIEKNQYDKTDRLIKTERGYYSNKKIDVIDNYVYDNEDNIIEEYTENLSKDVIVIIGHQKFKYNKKGLLIAEEILRDKETQFEYLIEYK